MSKVDYQNKVLPKIFQNSILEWFLEDHVTMKMLKI